MKQTLQNLLAEGKTKQAIAELMQLSTHDTDLKAEVVQLSARYAEYERQKRMGLEDPSVLGIELNKINNALLSIIGQLKGDSTPSVGVMANHLDAHPPKQGFSWTKWTGLNDVKSWIAVLAGLAGIVTFYFKYCKGDPETKLINVSVYVEDKKSDLVAALKKEAYVLMTTEGGGRAKELIDDKSRASFQNIRVGDKVRLNVDFSEPYRPLNPDSIYTIPADGRINLIVGLQNLNRVFGTVLYRDHFLEGVLIDVEGLRDTTDLTGRFEIFIPENQQHQSPEVKFIKKGFKDKIVKSYPQTKEPLNIVMEK